MESRWIPIEEMLPEQHEKYRDKKRMSVLVSTQGGTVHSCNREMVQWRDDDPYWKWGRINNIIAWMPLPKAYKANRK